MRSLRASRPTRIIALTIGASALLAACGGGGDAPVAAVPRVGSDASTDNAAVTIERSRFEPTDVAVSAGGMVEFTNLDAFAHTVTAADASPVVFDSGSFGQDETFTQQFDEAGSFDYFCAIHPTMRATITVE
jgi:plastocyanin